MTPRYAIRVIAPERYAGDTFECSRLVSWDDYETFRLKQLDSPANFEVVELDTDGQVIG
jgi:hypothetical protein